MITCQAALRRAYLPRLAQAGRLGQLIARQAELCARTNHYEDIYGATCANLPADIINFQQDPLACAIAPGWREGVEIATVPLRYELRDGWLRELPAGDGTPTQLVTAIDGPAFNQFWLDVIFR